MTQKSCGLIDANYFLMKIQIKVPFIEMRNKSRNKINKKSYKMKTSPRLIKNQLNLFEYTYFDVRIPTGNRDRINFNVEVKIVLVFLLFGENLGQLKVKLFVGCNPIIMLNL